MLSQHNEKQYSILSKDLFMMAVNRRTRDEQVLEAIFNPENPVTDIEVSGATVNSCSDKEFLLFLL